MLRCEFGSHGGAGEQGRWAHGERGSSGTDGHTANRQGYAGADFSKWVKPGDVADLILWLADERAKNITGTLSRLTAQLA